MDTAANNKQTDLSDIHLTFADLGDRLHKCLDRLTTVGNRLADESEDKPNESVVQKEPTARRPGIISDLYRDADGYRSLIMRIENQIIKLEKQI